MAASTAMDQSAVDGWSSRVGRGGRMDTQCEHTPKRFQKWRGEGRCWCESINITADRRQSEMSISTTTILGIFQRALPTKQGERLWYTLEVWCQQKSLIWMAFKRWKIFSNNEEVIPAAAPVPHIQMIMTKNSFAFLLSLIPTSYSLSPRGKAMFFQLPRCCCCRRHSPFPDLWKTRNMCKTWRELLPSIRSWSRDWASNCDLARLLILPYGLNCRHHQGQRWHKSWLARAAFCFPTYALLL